MTPKRPNAGPKGKQKTLEEHIRAGTYRAEVHGPIPEDLDKQIFGPKSSPPESKPPKLGRVGGWAWQFICANATGLAATDFCSIEMASRMFAEWKKVSLEIVGLKPFGRTEVKYEKALSKMLRLNDRLIKLLDKFGMTPAARMKMFSATNMRLANAQAAAAKKQADESEPVAEVPPRGDVSDPVGKTSLDLYRPDAVA